MKHTNKAQKNYLFFGGIRNSTNLPHGTLLPMIDKVGYINFPAMKGKKLVLEELEMTLNVQKW